MLSQRPIQTVVHKQICDQQTLTESVVQFYLLITLDQAGHATAWTEDELHRAGAEEALSSLQDCMESLRQMCLANSQ